MKKIVRELERFLDEQDLKSSSLNKDQTKTRKIFGSGWTYLPNVRKFRITLRPHHPLLKEIGIQKRLSPELTWEPYDNRKYNAYAERQLKRLEKFRQNPKKYFRIVEHLMKRSTVFRTMSYNHVFPNWHRNIPFGHIMKVNREVDKIIKSGTPVIKYKRVYIPKGKETYRPLGVPSDAWRIYLHMYNQFLYQYLKSALLPSQHGFIPGKGTLSAWKTIAKEKLLSYKYIYEFDLKQFFPSVDIRYISENLRKCGVPEKHVIYIEAMNHVSPELPTKELLDETRYKNEWDTGTIDGNRLQGYLGLIGWTNETMHKFRERMRDFDIRNGYIKDDEQLVLKPFVTPKGNIEGLSNLLARGSQLLGIYGPTEHLLTLHQARSKYTYNPMGTPQGSPLSPLLCILALRDFLSQQPSLSYADDGFFYSNKAFSIQDQPFRGIHIHPEKSRWLRYGGKWLHPFRFLGLVYDRNRTPPFYSQTKKGTTENLSKDLSESITVIEKAEYLAGLSSNYPTNIFGNRSWLNVFASKYLGLIQSRMYSGWQLEEIEQDFTYKYGWNSLCYIKKNFRELNIFNSSSFASRSMIEIFRRKHVRRYRKIKGFKLPGKLIRYID